jgi:hypothetical protein
MRNKMDLGQQITEFFAKLFSPEGFPARWHCGQWTDFLGRFYLCEAIQLKFSQESISTDKDFIITFKNQLISIEPSLVEFGFAYEGLNKTFRLEAKTLIEELILRIGNGYSHITETLIIDFFKEILKEKKLQDEKEAFKRKIVWLKK